jgi:NAD(P)-dependent dehydrogenase (short-subunit alcohol dehydrogenase family)
MRLAGRVALVTGGGSGQGSAVAQRFGAEGARVGVLDRDAASARQTVDLIIQSGGEALALGGDVSHEAEVRASVEAVVAHWNALHILYNNAGVFWPDRDGTVAEVDPGIWSRVLEINLNGVYLCCKHALPHLLRHAPSCIVNVSSVAGFAGDQLYHAYAASKSALHALTRSIALRYGPEGVRANLICPGFIETPMVAGLLADDRVREQIVSSTALRRLGQPEDVAAAALYQASNEASFVTGATLVVDGGLVK